MSEPKQVIIVRKDLNMRKGKIASQAAHASMKVILDLMTAYEEVDHRPEPIWGRTLEYRQEEALGQWIDGSFAKICVSVDSEMELLKLYNKAKEAGIICALITDAGRTEFHGVPTNTCIAIGPDYPEKIDLITDHLKLL